jgi:hypothetical protein
MGDAIPLKPLAVLGLFLVLATLAGTAAAAAGR